jgi:hypothetical protein
MPRAIRACYIHGMHSSRLAGHLVVRYLIADLIGTGLIIPPSRGRRAPKSKKSEKIDFRKLLSPRRFPPGRTGALRRRPKGFHKLRIVVTSYGGRLLQGLSRKRKKSPVFANFAGGEAAPFSEKSEENGAAINSVRSGLPSTPRSPRLRVVEEVKGNEKWDRYNKHDSAANSSECGLLRRCD